MDSSTLTNYITKSFTALPLVEKWGTHEIQGTTGYTYSPQNIRPRGFFSSLYVSGLKNTSDKFYLSNPYIDHDTSNNTYTIRFTLGVLAGISYLGLFANVSYIIDAQTGADHLINGKTSLNVEFHENDNSVEGVIPPVPYSIPLLPAAVNTGISVLRSFESIAVWYESLNLDDSSARDLLLQAYVLMFIDQMNFGIDQAYLGAPTKIFKSVEEITSLYDNYIDKWPKNETSINNKWDDGALKYSFSSSGNKPVDIMLSKPTFFTTNELWVLICKFDLDLSGGKDEHITTYVLGDYKTDDTVNYAINRVLGVSAFTEYKESEGNVCNDITTEDGEDVFQLWFNDFVERNRNKSNDIVDFSTGSGTLLQSLIDALKSADPHPHPGIYSVNAGGNGPVHFSSDPNGNIFAGCSGYVYQLDQTSTDVLNTYNMNAGNHKVSLVATTDTLYAGSHGTIMSWNSDNNQLSHNWTQTLSHQSTSEVLIADQLYVGCYGYVYKLDKATGQILDSVDLSSLSRAEQTAHGDVYLAANNEALYCGCNGVVVKINMNTFSTTSVWILTGDTSTRTHLIPIDDTVCASVDGQVFKVGDNTWSTSLKNYQSHIGNDEVQLSYMQRDGNYLIMAGCNGYVFFLEPTTGEVVSDQHHNDYCSVHDNGRDLTSVAPSSSIALAGCNGEVYFLDQSNYSNSFNGQLPVAGETNVFFAGGRVYVGVGGFVCLQPLLLAV